MGEGLGRPAGAEVEQGEAGAQRPQLGPGSVALQQVFGEGDLAGLVAALLGQRQQLEAGAEVVRPQALRLGQPGLGFGVLALAAQQAAEGEEQLGVVLAAFDQGAEGLFGVVAAAEGGVAAGQRIERLNPGGRIEGGEAALQEVDRRGAAAAPAFDQAEAEQRRTGFRIVGQHVLVVGGGRVELAQLELDEGPAGQEVAPLGVELEGGEVGLERRLPLAELAVDRAEVGEGHGVDGVDRLAGEQRLFDRGERRPVGLERLLVAAQAEEHRAEVRLRADQRGSFLSALR